MTGTAPDEEAYKTYLARQRLTDARIVALVRGVELVPREKTDEVVVTLRTPLDIETSDERLRLFLIQARETQFFGERIAHDGMDDGLTVLPSGDDGQMRWRVYGWVQRLTQARKPYKGSKRYPFWKELPVELVKQVLGAVK